MRTRKFAFEINWPLVDHFFCDYDFISMWKDMIWTNYVSNSKSGFEIMLKFIYYKNVTKFEEISFLVWNYLVKTKNWVYCQPKELFFKSNVTLELVKDFPFFKVKKIWEDSLDSIPSPSPSWKFKLLAGKFTWGNKEKHWWVMSTNSNVLHLKQSFPPMIWIFNEGEGDGIESRLSS